MAVRFLLHSLRSHLQRRASSYTLVNGQILLQPTSHPQPISPVPLRFRFLSTSRGRNSSRPKHVDIGARARQIQTRRLWTYALGFASFAGFVVLVISTFNDQIVFYLTPTDALEKYRNDPHKNKFRLGGFVLEGSVTHVSASAEMEFVVTDLITDILVRYSGTVPDLFREGHSVVVEGFVKPFEKEESEEKAKGPSAKARSSDCYFSAIQVLAKHDEKYMPKEINEAIERNKKLLEIERLNPHAHSEDS